MKRAVALGLLLACLGSASASAQMLPRSEVAFSSGGRILAIDAAGNGRRLLSGRLQADSSFVGDSSPAFSPDGRSLAFARSSRVGSDDSRSEVFVARADGSAARPLTSAAGDTGEPAWSPDSRSLAFSRIREGGDTFSSSIVVAGADGRGERELATRVFRRSGDPTFSSPAWSPDGRRIAYTSTVLDRKSEFRPTLFTVAAGGSDRRLLARDAGQAAWSPDGRRIAFSGVRDRNGRECGSDNCTIHGELYVMDADGTDQQRLTRNEGDDDAPAWSPDGRRLAFNSSRNFPDGSFGEGQEVYSVRPDGSCLTWLTNGSPPSGEPAWRPGPLRSADPGACGAAGRKPLVEADGSRARRSRGFPVFWLGLSSRNLLVSDLDVSRRGAFVGYDDCGAFDPRACPFSVQLLQESVCSGQALLRRGLADLGRFSVRRGALFATQDGEDFLVVSGSTEIGFESTVDTGRRRARRETSQVFRGLRPVGRARRARLPRPVLPLRLVMDVRRTVSAKRRLGSTRVVARRLRVSRGTVSARLRLHRALRRLGRVRTTSCRR